MSSILSISSDNELDNEFKTNLEYRDLEQKFSYMDESAKAYYHKDNLKSAYVTKPEQTLRLEDYIEKIKTKLKLKEKAVLIVLGCGNLLREIEITKALNQRYNVDLIGIDSSKTMLELAEKNLKKCKTEALLLHADFSSQACRKKIDEMTSKYDKRIFTFIGGTLGNVNQTAIADSLFNLLEKKDLLFIDVVLRKSLRKVDDIKAFNQIYSLIKNPGRVKFWTLPLIRAGIPINAGKIIMSTKEETSVGVLKFTVAFKFKKLVKIRYKGEVIHFSKDDIISLYRFRIYHAPTFIKFFKDHGFVIKDKILSEKRGLFLFKKIDQR